MSTISEDLVISPAAGSRFLLPFTVDAASLSASAAAANAPVSNLQNKFPGKAWRGELPGEVSVYNQSSGAIAASMAEGQAFVLPDADSGADLSPFARTHKIVVVDNAGKLAWGYLGAAGMGETLGAEMIANGGMEMDSGWTASAAPPSTNNRDGAQAHAGSFSRRVINGTGGTRGARSGGFIATAEKLWRLSGWVYATALGTNTGLTLSTSGSYPTADGIVFGAAYAAVMGEWEHVAGYFSSTTSGTAYVWLATIGASAAGYFDDVSLKQVLTPPATGAYVCKSPDGSNGWAFIQYGFNPNDIVEFDVYPATVWLDVDFGEEVDLNALALVNHNLRAEARIMVMLGSSAGAEDVALGVFPGWTPFFTFDDSLPHGCGGFLSTVEAERLHWTGHLRLIYFDAVYNARYMRLGFWDPDNPAGLISVGRLLAGEYLAAESMPTVGGSLGIPDGSPVHTSDGGQTWRDGKPRSREASYQWDNTPGDQTFILWLDMLRRLGVARPFVADLMPAVMARNIDQRLNNLLYCEIPPSGIKALGQPFLDQGSVTLLLKESL